MMQMNQPREENRAARDHHKANPFWPVQGVAGGFWTPTVLEARMRRSRTPRPLTQPDGDAEGPAWHPLPLQTSTPIRIRPKAICRDPSLLTRR